MLQRNVADGVHRLAHADVNVYLIEDDNGVTMLDTGWPATFHRLETAPARYRAWPRRRACGATHPRALRPRRFGATGARNLGRAGVHSRRRPFPGRSSLSLPAGTQPPAVFDPVPAVVAGAGEDGAGRGLLRARTRQPGTDGGRGPARCAGPAPGGVHPGHTMGHCALHLPDRDVVISGDALVTSTPIPVGSAADRLGRGRRRQPSGAGLADGVGRHRRADRASRTR